jgi:ubiquinol-cytochrome c reductase cytochrome b subunit
MFFSGQILRWDPDAYWGLAVGGSMAGRVPIAGPWLVRQMLGGPVIGADSLNRFFALHVFVIPGALLFFLAVHLWLVLKRGISAPPVPGQPVDPKTYDEEYEKQLKTGVPFLGDAMLKDAFFSSLAVIVVVILAAVLGPKGPTGPPDPTLSGANPRPEWPFLWLFALLSLSPAGAETFIILVFPVILIAVLFLVPFVSNRGERAPSRRPVAVLSVIVIYTVLGVLTYQGATSPWSPQMTAWSGEPIPEDLVRNSSPLQLQGAALLQNKNCRNCHALEGSGGKRGPDLTGVGRRLTRDQLIDQISNGTPGGGNMPAYGDQISPAEMTALVAFLESLRPHGEPPAKPASARSDSKEYP